MRKNIAMTENIDDCEFISHIIAIICDYAVDHCMHPNDVLAQVAVNIIDLLKIATFNGWGKDAHK